MWRYGDDALLARRRWVFHNQRKRRRSVAKQVPESTDSIMEFLALLAVQREEQHMTAFRSGPDTLEDRQDRGTDEHVVGVNDDVSPELSTSARQTIDIPTAARMLGCSRGLAYKMAREGRLPVIQLSPRRIVVPLPALMRMLQGPAADDAETDDRTTT